MNNTARRYKGSVALLCSLTTFMRSEHGATAIEYALLASLIAAVIAGSVLLLGGKVEGLYKGAEAAFP